MAARFRGCLGVGVEGTGAYGAGLARYLASQNVPIVEVDRPDRKARRAAGKSDPLDAESAARAALGRVRSGVPKDRSGRVEALRNLRVARRSAVSQRADCVRRIKCLLVTAPDKTRAQLASLDDKSLLGICAAMRPDATPSTNPNRRSRSHYAPSHDATGHSARRSMSSTL